MTDEKKYEVRQQARELGREMLTAGLMAVASVLIQALLKSVSGEQRRPRDPFDDPYL